MNKRKLGAKAEQIAADFLEKQGYHILQHNFYSRAGEIDIIAKEGEYLVFVEVKYRSNASKGMPEEAVTLRKRASLIKTARYYLMKKYYNQEIPCRFDVVAILENEIRIIKNAFSQ